jgi:hypothetical protein
MVDKKRLKLQEYLQTITKGEFLSESPPQDLATMNFTDTVDMIELRV